MGGKRRDIDMSESHGHVDIMANGERSRAILAANSAYTGSVWLFQVDNVVPAMEPDGNMKVRRAGDVNP